MPKLNSGNLFNFLWFQLIWVLILVFQYELLWLALLILAAHFCFSCQRLLDVVTALTIALAGVAVDSVLTLYGILVFPVSPDFLLIPLWLVVLWAAFAISLRYCMHYLHSDYRLSALLGAVFGPLSYYAGARLGAVSFGPSVGLTCFLLGIVWAGLLPLLLKWVNILEQWAWPGQKIVKE